MFELKTIILFVLAGLATIVCFVVALIFVEACQIGYRYLRMRFRKPDLMDLPLQERLKRQGIRRVK